MLKAGSRYLAYNPKLKNKARELRQNMSEAEKKLWYQFLKNFKFSVLRQRPIDNYIVDFYCAELKLVIEVDGATHSSEEEVAYDKKRESVLKNYGLKILRFNNSAIYDSFKYVCDRIEEKLKK